MFHQEFSRDVFALRLFAIIHGFVSYALQSIYEQESDDGVSIKVKILYLSWEFSLDVFANTFIMEAEDIKDELGALFIFYWSNMQWMRIWPWKCCTVGEESTLNSRNYQSESPKSKSAHNFHCNFFPYFLQVGNPSHMGKWILMFCLTVNLHIKIRQQVLLWFQHLFEY